MRAVITSVAVAASLVGAAPSAAEPEDLRATQFIAGNVQYADARGGVVWRGACVLHAAQEQNTTGANYEGALAGATAAVDAVTASPASIPFRCFVRVNFAEVATTAALERAVVSRATFAAGVTDYVEVCAEIGSGVVECGELTHSQFPAQAVEDAVVGLSRTADPALCPVLAVIRGADPVTVTPEGDVYVQSDREWDCPMYDD